MLDTLAQADTAEILVNAEAVAEKEIEQALVNLRDVWAGRIRRADAEIPIKFAEIKALEQSIEWFKKDRIYFVEQLRVLDRRIADLRETR